MSHQPDPTPGEGDVWAEVIADGERKGSIPPRVLDLMRERRQVGIDRYGVPLQRGNGRDGLRDLLEELLDAVAYSALCGRQLGILVDLISMLDADMRKPVYDGASKAYRSKARAGMTWAGFGVGSAAGQ